MTNPSFRAGPSAAALPPVLDGGALVRAVVSHLRRGVEPATVSGRFHHGLTERGRRRSPVGGVFQRQRG